MANNENLKKGELTRFRTGEEQARTASRGGKASGESRRRKADFWSERLEWIPVLQIGSRTLKHPGEAGDQRDRGVVVFIVSMKDNGEWLEKD